MAMSSSLQLTVFVMFLYCQVNHLSNGFYAPRTAYKNGNIMLGGLFDLHKSVGVNGSCGDLLAANLGSIEAMIFAIESINQNHSLLPNVTLGYDIRDYCLRPAKAVETAYELVVKSDSRFSLQNCTRSDGYIAPDMLKEITGVVGPMDSASAVMVSSLFDVAHIPSVSPLATSVELSSNLYAHFYRTIAPDNWRASLLADMAHFFNWTYVAAVALDDSFGRYGIWGLEREAFDRSNFCIAFTRFVPRVDHFNQLQRIVHDIKKNEKVKVIFIWLYGEYAQDFIKEAVKQNLKGRTWIFTDGTTPNDPFFEDPRFADILNGSFGIFPKAQSSEGFKKYLTNLAERNFSGSTHPWWEEYWKYLRLTPKSFINKSLELARSPYIAYTIDAVYVFAHALHNMFQCNESQGLLRGGACPVIQHSKIKNDDLDFYIRNISFQGLTGRVEFDQYGDPIEASYDVKNFKSIGRGFEDVHVGWWAKNAVKGLRLNINVSIITWKSENGHEGVPVSVCSTDCPPGERKVTKSPCCWECVKCPPGTISTYGISSNCTECPERQKPNENRTKCVDLPLNNLQWKSGLAIAVGCTAAVGMLLTVFCIAMFIKHRNSPIVKASNKELSFILLIAVAMFFVLAFLNLVTPTDILCCILNIWRYTVYTLCVSILLLKSRKIFKAFRPGSFPVDARARSRPNNKRFAFLFKGERSRLLFFLSIQVILTVNWIIFDPPTKAVVVRQLHYIFVVCKPFSSGVGQSLLILIAVHLLVLSFACIYYAFKGRKIPENFNEARYIGFSMYIVLLCSIAYYPVEFGLEGWYVGVIGGVTTLVSSFALLACMFGPKIYVICFSPEQNTREAISKEIAKYSMSTSASVANKGRIAPTLKLDETPRSSQDLDLQRPSSPVQEHV